MNTDTDRDPEELTATQAFARCDAHRFRGKELQPLTPQRYAAAMACGMAYGTEEQGLGLIKVGETKDGEPTYVYRKLIFDVPLVLYLCSVESREVRAAFRDPDSVVEKAMQWADEHKLFPDSEEFATACGVFSAIMADVSASRANPKLTPEAKREGRSSPNSPGRRRGRT